MKEFLVDIPVLLLFFARPEQTRKVFEQIKKARPSKLYLYQDGPRDGRKDDLENIMECRRIVEEIDWDCEVHKFYNEKNVGCDPAGYLSRKWMFEVEEYGIIFEDDTVPSQSFFPFCKELLEKYKYDERIQMVCGYNVIDQYSNSQADYFFSKAGSIWGWATWKRVIDGWDPYYKWLEDKELTRMFLDNYPSKAERKNLLKACKKHKSSGKAYFETINAASMMLNNRVSIVPTKNMICNIGVGVAESTHSTSNIKRMRPKTRKLFNKKVFDYEFPLKHPEYVACDMEYKYRIDKAYGNSCIDKFIGKLWALYAKIMYIFKI